MSTFCCRFTMPKNALNIKVKEIVKETMSLNILEYDSSNYHQLLANSLAALVTLVETKRQDIANTQSW